MGQICASICRVEIDVPVKLVGRDRLTVTWQVVLQRSSGKLFHSFDAVIPTAEAKDVNFCFRSTTCP